MEAGAVETPASGLLTSVAGRSRGSTEQSGGGRLDGSRLHSAHVPRRTVSSYGHQQRSDEPVVASSDVPLSGDHVPASPHLGGRAALLRAASPAQTDQSGPEVVREERVEDRIEAAVGVGETAGGQSDGDERGRDGRRGGGVVVEVLDDEYDVDRQPAGTEHRHDDDDQARHPASSPRRLGRPPTTHRPLPPGARAVAGRGAAVSAEQAYEQAGVERADQSHRQNEGEGEERAIEDAAVSRIGHYANVEARRAVLRLRHRIAVYLLERDTLLHIPVLS